MDLDIATDAISGAGAALTAAGRESPGAPIAACPGWTVDDVMRHVGQVQGWVSAIVRTGAHAPFPDAPDAAGAALADWTDEQRGGLLAVLMAADADQPVWAFGSQQPARFWWRRQAHEAAVHAWDATEAVGRARAIPGDVGADGVDEFFDVFLSRLWAKASPEWAAGRTIHLHRTDGPGEWLLAPPRIDRGHAKGDLAVRGAGGDLLLWCVNRPVEVELLGDRGLADAWRTNVAF